MQASPQVIGTYDDAGDTISSSDLGAFPAGRYFSLSFLHLMIWVSLLLFIPALQRLVILTMCVFCLLLCSSQLPFIGYHIICGIAPSCMLLLPSRRISFNNSSKTFFPLFDSHGCLCTMSKCKGVGVQQVIGTPAPLLRKTFQHVVTGAICEWADIRE